MSRKEKAEVEEVEGTIGEAPKRTLLEKEIDEYYTIVAAGAARGKRVGRLRRIAAYTLKTVAAGGSLVVASGLFTAAHQGIGIAILAAVLLDSVSSNHKRLLSEVEAGYAFRSLGHDVRSNFNRKLSGLIERKKQGGEEAARATEEELALQAEAHEKLATGIADIQKQLAAADLDALRALSLEHEKSAAYAGK